MRFVKIFVFFIDMKRPQTSQELQDFHRQKMLKINVKDFPRACVVKMAECTLVNIKTIIPLGTPWDSMVKITLTRIFTKARGNENIWCVSPICQLMSKVKEKALTIKHPSNMSAKPAKVSKKIVHPLSDFF